MTTREERIAETFVELADTLVDDFDAIDFLHKLAERSVELLDADAVGIMLADQRGGLHPVASSSEEARLIELFETQNDEGPCLDCYRTGQPVGLAGLEEMRVVWPTFTSRLQELGFGSAQAIPLRLRSETIGALNIFRSGPGRLSPERERLGQALADVATIGLLQERVIAARDVLAEQLQSALNSRIVLEQAKGILAERSGLGVNEAFDIMRRHARSNGLKLTAVAADIIDGSPTDLSGSAGRPRQARTSG